MDLLLDTFKVLLLICGSLILLGIIVNIINIPFRARKIKQQKKELAQAFDKCIDKIIEESLKEIEEEEENKETVKPKRKYTKRKKEEK